MGNWIYADFCTLLLGPKGIYWSDVGPIEQILCKIIYSDYYDHHKQSSREVILRYLAGNSQLSPKIRRHYRDTSMREQLRDNMINLAMKSQSDIKVYRICSNVHSWLIDNYPRINGITETAYISSQSTIANAALYLGDVLYHVMLPA